MGDVDHYYLYRSANQRINERVEEVRRARMAGKRRRTSRHLLRRSGEI
jgi:hypothetical protein